MRACVRVYSIPFCTLKRYYTPNDAQDFVITHVHIVSILLCWYIESVKRARVRACVCAKQKWNLILTFLTLCFVLPYKHISKSMVWRFRFNWLHRKATTTKKKKRKQALHRTNPHNYTQTRIHWDWKETKSFDHFLFYGVAGFVFIEIATTGWLEDTARAASKHCTICFGCLQMRTMYVCCIWAHLHQW